MNVSLDSSRQSIYRFVSFDNFIDLIQRKALTFVARELLKDPYEGYVYGALRTSSGREQILSILREHSPENAEFWVNILPAMDKGWYIQSWSRCSESDALWRIYSHNNRALRVEVSLEDIGKLPNVHAHDVEYKDNLTLKDEIETLVSPEKKEVDTFRILLCKRSSFSHEQEVRLLSFERDNLETGLTQEQQEVMKAGLHKLYQSQKITEDNLKTGLENIHKRQRRQEKFKRISFEGNTNFIKSVMIHPLAPDWVSETVNTFCDNNNLPYLGRSNLYTFSV